MVYVPLIYIKVTTFQQTIHDRKLVKTHTHVATRHVNQNGSLPEGFDSSLGREASELLLRWSQVICEVGLEERRIARLRLGVILIETGMLLKPESRIYA